MKNEKTIRITAAFAAALIAAVSLCGCNDRTQMERNVSSQTFSAVSIPWEAPPAEALKKQLIGQWGRLGEIMHEFYDDDTCIVGGMFGDYEITESGSLILITTKGSKTEYVYGDDTAQNFWELSGDTLTVNGNQFTRILSETADQGKSEVTADSAVTYSK